MFRHALKGFVETAEIPAFLKQDVIELIEELGQYKEDVAPALQEGVDNVLNDPRYGYGADGVGNATAGEFGRTAEGSGNGAFSSGTGGCGAGAGAGAADAMMKGTMDMIAGAMQDETEEASSSSGGGKGGGGNGNWLVKLARVLGKISGEHLRRMVELGEKMGGIDSKENPEAFASTQAEFQAEAQMFKMFQEALATMMKTIGEGMSTVARKQ